MGVECCPGLWLQAVVAGIAGFWLFSYYRSSNLGSQAPELMNFASGGLSAMLNLSRNLTNVSVAFQSVGWPVFALAIILALVAYVYSRYRHWRVLDVRWALIFLAYSLAGILIVSGFIVIDGSSDKTRHAIPSAIGFIGLFSIAVAQIAWTLNDLFQDNRALQIGSRLLLGLGVPFLRDNLALIRDLQRTNTENLLWLWADVNVPLDGLILLHPSSETEDTWNRPWSGYDGSKPFEWWFERDIPASTPAEYVERGLMYFASDERAVGSAAMQAFVSQLTLVKTTPENLKAGRYRLVMGLYDFITGARLPLADGGTYTTINVQVIEPQN